VVVVFGEVICHSRDARVHVRATEFFRGHFLPRRCFHQRRPGEEDCPGALDDHGLVGHGGNVRSARGTRTHHRCDLGNGLGRHASLVEKDPAEMFSIREHLGLKRKKCSARINQVDAGKMILLRDFLPAKVLLHGERIVGSALHRGVVGDDQTLALLNAADSGDDAGRGRLILVQPVGGQRREFQERSIRIEQLRNPLAGSHFPLFLLTLLIFGSAALPGLLNATLKFFDQRCDSRAVLLEVSGGRVEMCLDDFHVLAVSGER
jgi:hypothetical protein